MTTLEEKEDGINSKCRNCIHHQRVLDMYSQGYTIDEIMEATDARSPASVWYVLRKNGINPPNVQRKLDLGKMQALIRAGWTNERIIEEFRYGFRQREFPDYEIEAEIRKVRKLCSDHRNT